MLQNALQAAYGALPPQEPMTLDVPPPAPFSAPDPGATLADASREDLASVLTPQHVYLVNRIAQGRGALAERDNAIDRALRGENFDTQRASRTQEDLASAADALTQGTAHLDDDQFDDYLRGFQRQVQDVPTFEGPAPLHGPNLAQLALAAGGALLMPKFAAAALATPFEAQLRQQQTDQRAVDQRNQLAYKGYDARVDGARTALDAYGRYEATADGIRARREAARAAQQARTDSANDAHKVRLLSQLQEAAGNEGKITATLTALDAAGFGGEVGPEQRAQMLQEAKATTTATAAAKKREKDETLIAKYLGAADDPNADPEARAANARYARALIHDNDPNDARLAVIDQALPAYARLTQKQRDDHARSVATTANTVARTTTETQTRQGKIQRLLDDHRLAEARTQVAQDAHELDEIRIKYLPGQMAAKIAETNAQADAAHKRANDSVAGARGRGGGSVNAWNVALRNAQTAEDKARANIAGIGPVKAAMEARSRAISVQLGQLGMPDPTDKAAAQKRAALEKEKVAITSGLSKLGGVYAKSSYQIEAAKRAKEEATNTLATLQSAQAAPIAPSGPFAPNVRAAPGDIGSGTAQVQPPSGWSIKKRP